MGDVLPPKRDTVERLRRRVELYRGHHASCLPIYEQAVHNIREAERQETLLLRQRYLESKAKKAKNKNEHHRAYKDIISDSNKTQVAKPVKRSSEEPSCNGQPQGTNNDEIEKPSKIARTETLSEKKPDLNLQQTTCLTSSLKAQQSSQQNSPFSVQIVQNFPNPRSAISPTIQTNVSVQNVPKRLDSPLTRIPTNPIESSGSQKESSQLTPNIECKKEIDSEKSDFCQASNNSNSCGPLSDSFPNIEVNDESGVDILPPEILHDLIADMTENPDYPYLMTAFFDDNVDCIKDQDNDAKDILDFVKETPSSFQSSNLPLVPSSSEQQINDMFGSVSVANENPVSSVSSTVSTTSMLFNQPSQRQPPSYMNLGMDCLPYDYKMSEQTGSLAARTLKQLAEQHQNLQQQVFQNPLSKRSAFNQDNNFINQTNHNSSNFLTGSNALSQNNEKTSSSYTLDRLSEELFGSIPMNCDQISSSRFETNKQKVTDVNPQQLEPQKPLFCSSRPLTHFSESVQPRPNNINLQHMSNGPAQLSTASKLGYQLPSQPLQSQGQSNDYNQQQISKMQNHSNLFNNFSQQPSNTNKSFQVSASQPHSYSSQFSPTLTKPPPDYKSHHHSLGSGSYSFVDQSTGQSQPTFNLPNKSTKFDTPQRPPNVTITPDGSAVPSSGHDWGLNITNVRQALPHQNQQRSGPTNFGNFVTGVQNVGAPVSPLYKQARFPGTRVVLPGHQMSLSGSQMQVYGNQMQAARYQMQGQIPGPRNQMTETGNAVIVQRNQIIRPRNQILGPRNQMPMSRSQAPALVNSIQMPRNQIPHMTRANMMLMQQHQRIVNVGSPQLQPSPPVITNEQQSSMRMNNNSMSPNRTLSPMGPMGLYATTKDIITSDGTLSPMGVFSRSKDVIKNDNVLSPTTLLGPYSGAKNPVGSERTLSPMSPLEPFSASKDIINRNDTSQINLDIFDNAQYLFDLDIV